MPLEKASSAADGMKEGATKVLALLPASPWTGRELVLPTADQLCSCYPSSPWEDADESRSLDVE